MPQQTPTPPSSGRPRRRHDTGAILADIAPLKRARRTWLVSLVRLLVVLLVVGCGVWAAHRLVVGGGLTEEDIRVFIKGFGAWGPAVFLLVFATLGSLVIPTTALTVVGAALFGPLEGFMWSLIGAFVAAMLGFMAARTLGRGLVERFLSRHEGRVAELDARLASNGFATAFFMRLIYLPNGLINVVCGISAIPARVYALATLLGLAPMVFAVALVTGGVKKALLSGDLSALLQLEVVLSALVFLACISVPVTHSILQRRRRGLTDPE